MNDKISGYYLDNNQQAIVLDESQNLLVVAGAGSGKTLTILGKINYLIKYKNVLPSEILCISFTRASANSLKDKILKEFNYNMDVYTFHKLSLEILKDHHINDYEIADDNTLENIIHEFFSINIYDYPIYLKKLFKYLNIESTSKLKETYKKFYYNNYDKIIAFEKLLSTFLRLFKCNNYSLEDFTIFVKKARKTIFYFKYRKEKIFLSFALNLYLMYQSYLKENSEIDFDDMIINATKVVDKSGIKNNYKYVIIDEYQDTSIVRFNLIKTILAKTNAKLMVVGDDFQSIYRFAGCDLSLFINFEQFFNDAKIMKIENTYRNSQQLINIAGDFVMRNKSQISKNLKSSKQLDNPIEIIYYDKFNEAFYDLVLKISSISNNKPIMILGRNNNDVNMILDKKFKLQEDGRIVFSENNNIKLYFLTTHKSKGLEEENVIIINLENKLLGFPSQIVDDKILRFVSCSFEKYPYSEERRLFYVALTRTKNKAYLLVPKNNPSIFVLELVTRYKKNLKIYNP